MLSLNWHTIRLVHKFMQFLFSETFILVKFVWGGKIIYYLIAQAFISRKLLKFFDLKLSQESCKLKTMECQIEKNEHFRHVLLYEFNRGAKAAEAARNICAIYGKDSLAESLLGPCGLEHSGGPHWEWRVVQSVKYPSCWNCPP